MLLCFCIVLFIQLSIVRFEYVRKYSVASIIDGIKLSMEAIIIMNAEFNEEIHHHRRNTQLTHTQDIKFSTAMQIIDFLSFGHEHTIGSHRTTQIQINVFVMAQFTNKIVCRVSPHHTVFV